MEIKIIEMKQDGMQVEFLAGVSTPYPYRTTQVLQIPFNISPEELLKIITEESDRIIREDLQKYAVAGVYEAEMALKG